MEKDSSARETIRLENGFLVTPDGVVRSEIVLRDDKIDLSTPKTTGEHVIDVDGKYIVPGFVDIHFHGYNLFEFTAGLYDPETKTFDDSWSAYEDGFEMLSRALVKFGVTGFYVGSWASPIANLRNCYAHLYNYLSKTKSAPGSAKLLGGFLEGTFLNPKMAGAQNPDFALEPSPQVFDSIEDNGTIKLANVAPDFGRPSYELTEYLSSKGIVVGAGHSNAACEQIIEATKAGLKYFIHLTNGPTGGSYKPFNGGGAIEAVLKSDELYAELILDGYHINPAYVRDIVKRKGINKIIGVTDCLFAAGSGLKHFRISGTQGQVSADGKYICVAGKPNTLCSSNLTMDLAFANILNWLSCEMEGIWNRRHEAMDFEDALVAAAKICSTNPSVLTGLSAEGFGSIRDGAQADLCVLDIAGSAGQFEVVVDTTIINGNVVYRR